MWFSGPVGEAVIKAKKDRHILLVFVEDGNAESQEMAESWADADVQQLCKMEEFVCLQIHGNSENFTFFSQYYPVVTFPMSFFIGPNGKPIEILTGIHSPAHLLGKIREVSQIHKSQMAVAAAPAPSNSVVGQPSTSTPVATATPAASSLPLSDKIEKAKELLEAQRRVKAQQEEEEERRKEIQRREQGKKVDEVKQKQKDLEIKEIADERRKAKQADKEALRKIREQIESDRKDKAAKHDQTKAEENVKKVEEERKVREAKAAKEAAELAAKSHSRIQFRIPTMPVINEKFPADDPLQTVYDFVALNVPFTDFTLIQMYPRREFTLADSNRTLRDLGLVPSSVLLVVPPSSSSFTPRSTSGEGFNLNTLVQWLFYPLTLVYTFVIGLFFGTPRPAVTSSDSSKQQSRRPTDNSSKDVQKGSGSGNVSRLTDLPKDDDDTATWNGNSTQQL